MTETRPLSVFNFEAIALKLHPGDVLLFRTPERMSDASRAHVAAMLDEVFPDHESIILENGQDIAVLRPEPGAFGRLLRGMFGRPRGEGIGHG